MAHLNKLLFRKGWSGWNLSSLTSTGGTYYVLILDQNTKTPSNNHIC